MAAVRRVFGLVMIAAVAVAAIEAGCGDTGDDSGFGQPAEDQEGGTGTPPTGFGGDGSSGGMDAIDTDALGVLVVSPPTATIPITIVNGVVTVNAPVQFTATYNGSKVAAQWLFDRGELGDVDTSGLFTASGSNVGKGTLTARFGAREGTASVIVTIASKENGATAGADAGADGGFGGLGGVGGEPLGGAVSPTIQSRLETESTAPASAAELGYLYPYDKTVWPRGLLAPLVMYQTTHDPDAVYVKLSQGNYSFEGVYSLAAQPSGSDARKRVRIEDAAWLAATNGNQGDDLQIDVKVHTADDDKVYGPITEKWKVASGILKGTIYYNSYDSALTGGAAGTTGGIISIKPRSPSPSLAVPANAGKCNVCHTVSADGSTLWAQDANYTDGASYDLKNGAARTAYLKSADAANDHKFVWSAPYPDGSFALVSSRYAREAYLQNDAKLFARSNGSEVASTYGAGALSATVQSAVTPAFSPDGKKVVFNFWEGAGAGGVVAGAGRSLAIMDFGCGAAAGSVTCSGAVDGGPGTGAHTFSNLREIYKDATRFPAWPTFLPDAKAVVFHNTVQRGSCGPNPADRTSPYNCQISTWFSAESELWWAADSATKDARAMDAANGKGYVPTSASHPDDSILNYEPTVNPVASGGYYWVVFTSRRMYGNLETGLPWGADGQTGGPIKKLWVAAIDINPMAGADPSHPAFYIPGQEINAGNTRGFWVVDPCKANGSSCESGDECCNGFCRKDPDGGALVCMDKPPGTMCSMEFEKCMVDADCCDPTEKCINGKCAQGMPAIK